MKRLTFCILLLAVAIYAQDFGFFYGTPNDTAGDSNVLVGVNSVTLSNRVAEVAIQANAAYIALATNPVTRWYSSETNWLEWSGNELREFVITRAPMEDPQVISITFSSDFDSVWGDFPYAGQTLIVPKYYAAQIEATPGSGFYWSFLFDATNHYGYVAESAPVGVFNIWESDSPSETPYTVGPRDDPFGGGIGTGSAVVSNVHVYGAVTNLMSTRYMLDSQNALIKAGNGVTNFWAGLEAYVPNPTVPGTIYFILAQPQ